MRRKLEVGLYIGLGVMLGLGIATYRNFMPGGVSLAQEKEKNKEPGGVFSPPGSSESVHRQFVSCPGAS